MNLDNIRQKPKFIDVLPGLGRGTCHALYPNIYLSRSVYMNLTSEHPSPYTEAVVLHEQEHLNRMKQYGVMKWYLKYLTSRSFRLDEELAATEVQLVYIKAAGGTLDLERRARQLSGPLYLWAAKYDTVLGRLMDMWDKT